MKKQFTGIWWFLIPLAVFIILGIYQCFTMAHAVNAVDRVQRIYDPANPGDSATVRDDTLNAMALTAIKAVKVRVTQRLETDSIVGTGTSVSIVDDTLWINRDSTNCVAVVWFAGTGAGIKYNCTTDSLYWTRNGSTWVQFGTGSGGGGGVDEDSVFNAFYSQRWYPHPSLSGQYIGDVDDSGFVEFVDSTTGNAYIRTWTPIFYWEIFPESALVTWGRVQEAIAATGSGDITGVITNDWITGSAASGDVSLGIDPTMLAALYLGGDTTFVDGDFVKLAADTSLVLDLYRGVAVADSAYPTWGRVNAAIGAAGGGDITSVALGNGGGGDGTTGAVTLNVVAGTSTGLAVNADSVYLVWTWLYTFVDTTSAKIPTATLADTTVGGAARATRAAVADSAVKGDTAVTLQWAEGRTIAHDSLWGNSPSFFRTAGNGLTSSSATVNVVGGWSMRVFPDSIAIRQLDADSITAGTVADARIATTLCRDTEASGLAHDTLWANTPGFATKANVHDSLFANTPGFGTKINIHDSIWANTPLFFRTAGNGLTSSSATVNVVGSDEITVAADSIYVADSKIKSVHIEDASLVGADMATGTIDSIRLGTACVKAAEIDTTVTYVIGNLRTRAASQGLIQSNNFKATDPDSSLKIGSGPAGLTIGSAITLGTDITDDTTVVEYYPEPNWAVLGDGIMPTYKDSMRIYGDVDSIGNIGNVLVFSDTLLNSGQHRRGFQITIAHPLRVDSLRYVYIEGIVKDSSGTNEMYLRGQLRTTTHTRSSVDSLTAGNVKDYDSLGGDYGDNAVLRKVYLTGGAVTAGGKWYLLLSARHDAGTAYNWAKVGRICAVYSRTKL